MNNIFTNWIAMDCFCCDIIEAWINHREKNGEPYDEDSYFDWLQDEFMAAMECAYSECVEDREVEENVAS